MVPERRTHAREGQHCPGAPLSRMTPWVKDHDEATSETRCAVCWEAGSQVQAPHQKSTKPPSKKRAAVLSPRSQRASAAEGAPWQRRPPLSRSDALKVGDVGHGTLQEVRNFAHGQKRVSDMLLVSEALPAERLQRRGRQRAHDIIEKRHGHPNGSKSDRNDCHELETTMAIRTWWVSLFIVDQRETNIQP